MGAFRGATRGFAGAFEGRIFGLRALLTVTGGGAAAAAPTLALTVRVPRWGLRVPLRVWGRCGLADFGQPVVQLPFVCCGRLRLKTKDKRKM